MSGRSLQASINGVPVGLLEEVDGLWSFRYDPAWLAHPQRYPLSPHLPLQEAPLLDGASRRPVQWYFDNLLPEEGQRLLLAKEARLDAADAFGLLGWYGAESAGSLVLLPPGTSPGDGSLRALPDDALDARIRQLPRAPLIREAAKRMSLAGAQHKLAVVLQDGALYEPGGATPSTHILKPDHPDADYPHSVANEWFVMRLARRLGLPVPDVQRRYVPAPVYLVARFDRAFVDGQWQRRHAIDACQLLGLDRSFKYHEGSVENLAALAKACRTHALARTRLYQWLVFNMLVGNSDAHLKNLSFLVSPAGIQPAPFYDLLGIAAWNTRAFDRDHWPGQTELAWPLAGARYFADLDRALLLQAGATLGLNPSTATRLLENLCNSITREATALYDDTIAENRQLIAAHPELACTLAGEARCLRGIVHIIIHDMTARLS